MGEQKQPLQQYIIDDRSVVILLQEHGFLCQHDIRGWYLTNCVFTGDMPPQSCTLPDGTVLYRMGTHIVRKGSAEYLKWERIVQRKLDEWRANALGYPEVKE